MRKEKSELATDECALAWKEDNIPVSVRFGDSFYSVADGRAETDHVFVRGNSLPERWPAMPDCTIAELGFGTGLNFLETLRQWRICRAPGTRLHFVSFERYPLSAKQITRAHSRWPEIAELGNEFLSLWRTDLEMQTFSFEPLAKLTIFLCDANSRLPQLNIRADAWYLDGFAPARNPDLWSTGLLKCVFARTVPGGTFATYSAAGWVRRNLVKAGFTVERAPGFGAKREMLRGRHPVSRA